MDGTEVFLVYTIINEKGESVSVTEYGASVVAPHQRQRKESSWILHWDVRCAADYEEQTACLGVESRRSKSNRQGSICFKWRRIFLAVNNVPKSSAWRSDRLPPRPVRKSCGMTTVWFFPPQHRR